MQNRYHQIYENLNEPDRIRPGEGHKSLVNSQCYRLLKSLFVVNPVFTMINYMIPKRDSDVICGLVQDSSSDHVQRIDAKQQGVQGKQKTSDQK